MVEGINKLHIKYNFVFLDSLLNPISFQWDVYYMKLLQVQWSLYYFFYFILYFVISFYFLTGKYPFVSDDNNPHIINLINCEYESIKTLVPDFDEDLIELVHMLLKKVFFF
jgi:hypothetical protein